VESWDVRPPNNGGNPGNIEGLEFGMKK